MLHQMAQDAEEDVRCAVVCTVASLLPNLISHDKYTVVSMIPKLTLATLYFLRALEKQ